MRVMIIIQTFELVGAAKHVEHAASSDVGHAPVMMYTPPVMLYIPPVMLCLPPMMIYIPPVMLYRKSLLCTESCWIS